MAIKRYQALGPLLAGEGSRAFIGLEIQKSGQADPVVLVWVPEGADKDPALLARIRHETEHAAKLEHPNIVRVHGFAQLDEGYARVVEFADGESLRKLLEVAKKLPVPMAAKIVCDAATGVHYAHIAGNDDGTPLVHGDIRPETLLLSFSGAVKVTGYGALAFAPREIGGQRVKGRRVHTAPEQIIGGREAFALQTDVYLLGITLYECLTGTVPFADQGDFFDHAVLTLPLPPPTPGEVPPELEQIIFKACAKKIPERYPNPLVLREEIEKAMGGSLPTTDELAAFLRIHFPDSDKVRAGRRQAIDAGIADYARKVWAEKKEEPVFNPDSGRPMLPPLKTPMATPAVTAEAAAAAPRPPSRTGMPAVAAPRPPSQTGMPVVPAPRPPSRTSMPVVPSPSSTIDEEPEPSRRPLIIGAAVVGVLIVGVIFANSLANAPLPSTRRALESKPDAGAAVAVKPPPVTPPVAVEPDASTEPAVVDSGAAEVKPPVVVAVVDAGPAVSADSALVSIDSTPAVELTLDGKVIGHTPWRGTLPVGRKALTLINKELGLKTYRSIMVTAGEKNDQTFTFAQGFVTLTAPEGAQVFVDERRVGSAPIRGEIPVFEGSHRISVTVGKARWSEPFNLAGGQRINFNVEMQ